MYNNRKMRCSEAYVHADLFKRDFFYLSAYSCGKFMWRIKEKTAKDDFNEDVIRKDFKRLKNGMKY